MEKQDLIYLLQLDIYTKFNYRTSLNDYDALLELYYDLEFLFNEAA